MKKKSPDPFFYPHFVISKQVSITVWWNIQYWKILKVAIPFFLISNRFFYYIIKIFWFIHHRKQKLVMKRKYWKNNVLYRFVDLFMSSFLYCSLYSYCSSNYRDSDSWRSFSILKALAKSNGNYFAIALWTRTSDNFCDNWKEAKKIYQNWSKEYQEQ